MLVKRSLFLLACCAMCGSTALADDERASAGSVITGFAKDWDESLWQPKQFRGGYMRPLDDSGWKARMRALQELVKGGKDSVPGLVKALQTGKAPERILAAQALGYLAPHAPADVLLEAAKNDRNAAVQLYAVDSLGMQGKAAESVDWKSLLAKEDNRDVRMHIKYAQERDGEAVQSDVVAALKDWDTETINTAVVGKPAPDFTLKSAQDKSVTLSDFKGKKAVVLVFIYGDT